MTNLLIPLDCKVKQLSSVIAYSVKQCYSIWQITHFLPISLIYLREVKILMNLAGNILSYYRLRKILSKHTGVDDPVQSKP